MAVTGSAPRGTSNGAHPARTTRMFQELKDLWKRLWRLMLFALVAAVFLGVMYGLVVLWFWLMNPYA